MKITLDLTQNDMALVRKAEITPAEYHDTFRDAIRSYCRSKISLAVEMQDIDKTVNALLADI